MYVACVHILNDTKRNKYKLNDYAVKTHLPMFLIFDRYHTFMKFLRVARFLFALPSTNYHQYGFFCPGISYRNVEHNYVFSPFAALNGNKT